MASPITTQPLTWPLRNANRWLAYGIEVLLWLLVAVVLLRRTQSAFVRPLDPLSLWFALGLVATLSGVVRGFLIEEKSIGSAIQASVRLALFALSLQVSGISGLSVLGAWLIVALDMGWASLFLRLARSPRRSNTTSPDAPFIRRTTHYMDEHGSPYLSGTLHLTFAPWD